MGKARRRWMACIAAAVALHVLPVLVVAWRQGPVTMTAPAPSAIMVEMAPLPPAPPPAAPSPAAPPPAAPPPAAPPAPPVAIPPAPRQRVERPKPLPIKAPLPPIVPHAAAMLPSIPEPEPQRTENNAPVEQTTAPPVEQTTAPPAAVAPLATPTSGRSDAPSIGAPTWQALLVGQLERFKRYPGAAQSLRQQGIVYLRFTMDRAGKVISSRLEKSSGYDLLDREALALLQRAQPLPKPSASVPGDPLELVVPIEFFLRARR